jgi:hypothetical protein
LHKNKNTVKKLLFVLSLVISSIFIANAQKNASLYGLGIETQWYPAGYQLMLAGEYGFTEAHAIEAKLGYNLARRQDFSPYNDLENGGGFGATLGYRYYFGDSNNGLYLGARTDLWALTIDWEDAAQIPNAGTTDIIVLQPTAEIGYLYTFEASPIAVGVNAAAGYEINVVTKGEAVGEGAIGLLGVRFRYRFSK